MRVKRSWVLSLLWIAVAVFSPLSAHARKNALVFQTDFGVKDGAVSAMKGVAFGVDSSLAIFDLTHEIPPFNIWEAAYRLRQTIPYWPSGTVFVSVVDPGVGTERRSVVLKTRSGHFIVSPDNGTLTLVAEQLMIEEIRKIDEKFNRRKGSELSHTFHGRDVYALTGARLAAGVMAFRKVGPRLPPVVLSIPYEKPRISSDILYGAIPVLDIRYGNVWTNIGIDLFGKTDSKTGDIFCVNIHQGDVKKYSGKMPYVKSFGYVPEGRPLIYLNDLLNVAIAENQGNFAGRHHIKAGAGWKIDLKKCDP
ncbi:MAG: S-adenosyl-l-methionine hydroxide adenosyltransferase family protein [Desulfobacterales bacterium]|nr:S-adenosyl-l-methionine hydroxide adenosyltransferase family protein [Desulfobacterales bacterium]